MAASFVGYNGGGDGSAFSNSLTFTTARTIAAGEHVVVASRGAGVTTTAVSVGGLSLAEDSDIGTFEFWSAKATGEIASGATVTITYSGETSGGNKNGLCISLAGTEASSWVRASVGNGGFGASGNVGTTDTSPLTGDIGFSIVRVNSAKTYAGANGVTMAGQTAVFGGGYEVLASDGATGGIDFTWTGSDDYIAGIIVYKGAAEADTFTPRVTMF